jgi:hypothetical protein
VRYTNIPDPFLGNGSVNTFPLLGGIFLIMQHLDYKNGRDIFYVVRAERLYARRSLELSQLRVSSIWDLSTEAEE